MQHQQTHLFSLFTPNLSLNSWSIEQAIIVTDVDVIHRLISVLRFVSGDQVVFFNQQCVVHVLIQEVSKKNIKIFVQDIQKHYPLLPQVTFLLPLLKKEALEQAVYSLCELGVNKIQLVVTQKSRQNLLHEKEFVRLQNIVIAAAEQSKNYNFSQLLMPQKLSEVVSKISNVIPGCERESKPFNIVFDPAGASFFDLREKFFQSSSTLYFSLLVGPEGGLTEEELALVKKSEFVSCALTSTILTAVQAVALGAGLFRLQ